MVTLNSVRFQRQVARLLDELEEALTARNWEEVQSLCYDVLALEPDNGDAQAFLAAAKRALRNRHPDNSGNGSSSSASISVDAKPVSDDNLKVLIDGRYTLGDMIGEGGRKRVYMAADSLLDRQVAFAMIKTETLDPISRQRVTLEAQAMGRLGSHPHIVTVFDFGEYMIDESNEVQPYLVTELMGRGDVARLIEEATNNRPSLEDIVRVGIQVCRGLDFAHANGIVHRDVKPGNIWLTLDGTAKIGDFGLAMSRSKDRVTQAGNIVGTVTYMPPEQATGGEVTPQADLYSLGIVLYEMVCGRPPFLGYDPSSVIRQHIETPPVTPTWHNPLCPKPLEALILRLLAKEPTRRPDSAADVIKALESLNVETSKSRSNGTVSYTSTPENITDESLHGAPAGVFVGRDEEMDVLRAGLEGAMAGRGRFLMIEGEKGIGKTRVVHELAAYAETRGARALWGRGYEEGGMPSYWPWVQAIRSYVRHTETEQLEREMGAGASEIAVVVADVRQRLVGLEPPPDLNDLEQSRFRLSDAITTFLKNASDSQPLVIVLDDLQWADEPTVLLLRFLVSEVQNMRVLLIGTMRPGASVPDNHPLTESLVHFKRRRLLQRVLLSNLSLNEVERFIEGNYGVELSKGLIKGLHSQTQGNPQGLSDVASTLVQQASRNRG
jgi:serine/threonine protein kinase